MARDLKGLWWPEIQRVSIAKDCEVNLSTLIVGVQRQRVNIAKTYAQPQSCTEIKGGTRLSSFLKGNVALKSTIKKIDS